MPIKRTDKIMDKTAKTGGQKGIEGKRSEENSNEQIFYLELLCWYCAIGLWNILNRRHNDSSHNAIGVSEERRGLGKRVETVPPSYSLTKHVRLESSPAHRHLAVSYALNVTSRRAIMWIIVCRLSTVSRCLKC